MGKTVAKYASILIDGYDLSGDSNAYSIGLTFPPATVTAVSSGQYENLFNSPAFAGEIKTWFNTYPAFPASFERLKTPGTRNVTICQGMLAAPAVGDPAFCVQASQVDVRTDIVLNAAVKCDAKLSGVGPATSEVSNIFGVVLHPMIIEGATVTGAAVNNGAASTAGGLAFLQVISTISSPNWSFVVQDSADGATGWATIATFASTGSSITSEVQAIAGTIRQYTRCVATKTTGSVAYAVALVRGI